VTGSDVSLIGRDQFEDTRLAFYKGNRCSTANIFSQVAETYIVSRTGISRIR
jgi:hypothetical protein